MDSTSPRVYASPPPKIGQGLFLGFVWGGFALSTIVVAFRAWSRIHTFKRFFADDFFVLLALVMLLIQAIMWQITSDSLYQALYIASGKETTIPSTFVNDSTKAYRAQIGLIFLFYSSLWSIKVAFLFFFRRLVENVPGYAIHWWCSFGWTIATYIVAIGTIQYNCLAPGFEKIVLTCSGLSAIHYDRDTLASNLAIDISSDLLILSIPIRILWNVRMRLRRKFALAGIFCLVIITITIAIIRFSVVTLNYDRPEQSWLYFWNTIENSIAIIIACLASFRALFTKDGNKPNARPSDTSHKELGWRFMSLIPWSTRSRSRSTVDKPWLSHGAVVPKASEEQLHMPPKPPPRVRARTDLELATWSQTEHI